MTKRNLLLASLLLVLGLGIMVPSASAQGNGTVFNVNVSLYTLRPNSIGDAGGQIYLDYSSGTGIIAGTEVFTITFSKPIVGAAGIGLLSEGTAAADFCNDTASPWPGVFCTSMTYSASGNVLTLTNGAANILPTATLAGSYVTFWGIRFDTVGTPPGTFITATVGAVLNRSYPISFTSSGVTQAAPVNVGQVATTALGGSVLAGLVQATSILTCFGATSSDFSISVAEQWSGAWTSLSDELFLAPYAPTATNLVTNGSDISVTLSGIPLGVTVTVLDAGPVTTTPTDSGYPLWSAKYSPTTYTGAKANDMVTFDFPITATILDETESANFNFEVSTTGPIALQSVPMTASVTLNPMTPTSTPEYPAFTYPNGPLLEEPIYPIAVVDFIGCQTNLLFPYITNYSSGPSGGALGNWDTGIVVSNTSSDPYTELFGGAIPTAGTCAFYAYASTTGSLTPAIDATPVATWNTNPVYTGGVSAFMLSQTAARGLAGGYAIAVCNFLNGTGYAELVDNAGIGNWEVMGSYLAYVIPNPYVEPRWVDSVYGEFAISPWAFGFSGFAPGRRGSNSKAPTIKPPNLAK